MLVAIVGKPNVGKSTFFSALTLAPADIANYPFTTIKPNFGVGYVRKRCVCKELNVKCNPKNSICMDGERFIPVKVVDIAGLVPDAHKGRGLGNSFLSDIREADCLIHVVDISGSTDKEGNPSEPLSNNPADDVVFLENEIEMWMFNVVKRNIAKYVRSAGDFEDLFRGIKDVISSFKISREEFENSIKISGFSKDEFKDLNDDELLHIIKNLRKVTKPILIAANKIDIDGAEENLSKLKKLGYDAVPCCAEAELALRKAEKSGIIRYVPGDRDFEVIKQVDEGKKKALDFIKDLLRRYGSTGVQKTINTAVFDLLHMIAVYPVRDEHRFTDADGNILPDTYLVKKGTTVRELAYAVHTDIGEGFITAIDAKRKVQVGGDRVLEDNDVIKIISRS